MATPKIGTAKNGKVMHYSAGALIKKDGKYLLLDRNSPPFGYAAPAGHVDGGEDPKTAVCREVKEETGYDLLDVALLYEEEVHNNTCSKGVSVHYWYVFEGSVEGTPHRSERETKAMRWCAPAEIKKLRLEPVWEYWLKRKKIL